jgi:hypothetical protein
LRARVAPIRRPYLDFELELQGNSEAEVNSW